MCFACDYFLVQIQLITQVGNIVVKVIVSEPCKQLNNNHVLQYAAVALELVYNFQFMVYMV